MFGRRIDLNSCSISDRLQPSLCKHWMTYRHFSATRAIADNFNEYFANIGSDLARSLPRVRKSYKDFLH